MPEAWRGIGLVIAGLGGVLSFPAMAADFIRQAQPYLDARHRYEFVDQAGQTEDAPEDAHASTLRVRAGVRSGDWAGFSLLAEGEATVHLAPRRFNDTTNGKTAFPVVADPADVLLNQLALRWHDGEGIDLTIGRQAINIGNQRFVGTGAWRQNDQTLDAVMVQVRPLAGLTATYIYGWRVNRVFGPDSPQGIWRGNNIQLFHAEYDAQGWGVFSAYNYVLDLPDAPWASSRTVGGRWAGRRPVGELAVLWAAEYARQRHHGPNPNRFDLGYVLVEPGLAWGGLTLKAGWEKLGGDGVHALQTPLASLHGFNGWADKFLVTPPRGLRDAYVDMGYVHRGEGWWRDCALRLVYHDFAAARGGLAYGREWGAMVSRPIGGHLVVSLKAAHYEARTFATDTTKLWLTTEVKF